jgi:hypothetical protein
MKMGQAMPVFSKIFHNFLSFFRYSSIPLAPIQGRGQWGMVAAGLEEGRPPSN